MNPGALTCLIESGVKTTIQAWVSVNMQKITHLERKNYTYYAQLCTIISYQLSELLLSAQFYLRITAIIGQVKCTSDTERIEIKLKKVWHYRGSQIV